MFGLGTQELIIILGIVLFIFGAKKLPEIGKGLGKASGNLKTASLEKGKRKTQPNPKKSIRKTPTNPPDPFAGTLPYYKLE